MCDKTIQELLDNIRGEIPSLFRVCESIAMLDMLAAFGQLVCLFRSIGSYTWSCMNPKFCKLNHWGPSIAYFDDEC